jgi:hypothetical protein
MRLAEKAFVGVVAGGVLSGILVLAPGAVAGAVWAQAPVTTPTTADEIVARMTEHDRQRQAALESYGSERTYRINYHGPMGDRSAVVLARMDFSSPDQKRFTVLSETGSTIFCHKVLRRMMEGEEEGALEANHARSVLSAENYNFVLAGEDDVDGVKAWVLDVTPKVNEKFSYKGKVWVGMDDYAVVRIVGSPAKNPTWMTSSATFDYRYARNGRFWLPQHNTMLSHVRMGGEVTLTVDYGTYDIVTTGQRPVVAAARESRGATGHIAPLALAVR